MSKKVKIIIAVVILLVIGVLCFWIQKQRNDIAKLKAKNSELVGQKTLEDGTVRSQSSYASKEDIERLIKESGLDYSLVKKDIKSLNSELKGVQKLVASSKGFKASDVKSDSTTKGKDVKPPSVKCPDGETVTCPDDFGYLTNRQVLKLKEPFSGGKNVPVGEVGFSAWKEAPWDVNLHPRDYHVTTVVSVDENGKSNYHNKFTVDVNGEKHTVPVKSSNFVERYPRSKFHFNPRIYFGVDAGIMAARINGTPPDAFADAVPNAHVAFFSHGKTKLDTQWTFLGVGAGYAVQNESVAFTLSPVNYNIGKPIPLIDNLFLGPSVSLDTKGQVGVMLGLRVGL